MAERDAEKLLGGFATGTLTEEERQALYAAALHDQRLFDALADEEALRQLLEDPAVRRRLVSALSQANADSAFSWADWIAEQVRRPRTWAVAGGLAVAVLAMTTVTRVLDQVGPLSRHQEAVTEETPAGSQQERLLADESQPTESVSITTPEPDRRGSAAEPPLSKRTPSGAPVTEGMGSRATAEEQGLTPAAGRVSQPSTIPGVVVEGEQVQLPDMKTGNARELFYGSGQAVGLAQAGKEAPSRKPREDTRESTDAVKKNRSSEARRKAEPAAGAPTDRTALGLRYRLLKRGPEGVFAPTDPDGPFARKDAVRLTLDVNGPGYLYVLKQDSPGIWALVYPFMLSPSAEADQAPRVTRGPYTLPPIGAFRLEGPTGRLRFLVIYAREPQAALRPYLSPQSSGGAGLGPVTLAPPLLIRKGDPDDVPHPLIIEKSTEVTDSRTQDPAVYVVNPSLESAARILTEITLSY